MKRNELKKALTLVAAATIFPAAALSAPGPERGPKGPPPEAVSACEGKEAGNTVEFTNRRGVKIDATCREVDGRLIAVPVTFGKKENSSRPGERPLGRLSAALDLNSEQQKAIREIFAAEREKTAPLREQLHDLHAQTRNAIHSGQADEKMLRSLAEKEGELRAELLVARARAWKQIDPLLTAEQREKAAKGDFLFGGDKGHRARGNCSAP